MNEISVARLSSDAPLYQEVKRQLLEALRREEWAPGQALPSEHKLSARFGVSIGTLRKAVDELAAQSLLMRHQGRGTYVAVHNPDRFLYAFFHVVRHDGHKEHPHVALERFEPAKADGVAAAKLGLEPGSCLFRMVNRLELGGETVLVDEVFVPQGRFSGLTEQKLRKRPATLYQLYQEEFRVTVLRIEERLRAVKAGAFAAALLRTKIGDPLLQVTRVAFSFNNQPVELRFSYLNTQRYEYFADPAPRRNGSQST